MGHGIQRYLVDNPFNSDYLKGKQSSSSSSVAGYLVSVDAYMNLQLANTEEFIEGQFTGNLGEVLIRCADCLCCAAWSRSTVCGFAAVLKLC